MVFNVAFGNIFKDVPIYQYLAMFTSTLTVISSGMLYGWPSPSLPILLGDDSPIPMTNDESSWVVVALLFGTFCGADVGGIILDRIGRKNVILLCAIPTFTAWMMIAFAQSVPELLAARFVAGLSDGLTFCAVPMYLGEIANTDIRGFMGSYISIALILGMLLMNVIGSYFTITEAALVVTAVPVLLLVTFSMMPESPYYLIMKGHQEKARKNLQILKGVKDVDSELDRLTKAVKQQNANKTRCWEILTIPHHRKALFIGAGVRAAQQFAGMMVIAFYAQTIFKETQGSISPVISSSIYFGVYTTVTAFSSTIVDKTGRKPLMIFSIIGNAVALMIAGIYFYLQNVTNVHMTDYTWVSVFALTVYVITFSMGMQPIPSLLVGEIFETNVKAVGLACCSNSFSVSTIIASKFFQITMDKFGIHVPFLAFSFMCVLILIFIIFYVPETKGKTLEAIQEELKGEHVETASIKLPEKFTQIKDH